MGVGIKVTDKRNDMEKMFDTLLFEPLKKILFEDEG